MDSAYCIGSELQDVNRMFDNCLYKGADNFNLSLSIPEPQSNGFMAGQTFHAPSFGDEEFDIPAISLSGGQQNVQCQPSYTGGPSPVTQVTAVSAEMAHYQQQHHITELCPMTTMSNHQQNQNYNQCIPINTMAGPGHGQQHDHQHVMYMNQQVRPHYIHSNPAHSPINEHNSDDSDELCKRPSPEPVGSPVQRVAVRKPKAPKKKKKRDPNEPQKPVSAYALFFRDTQAAIKGQNPNASFGEVSKIVASMWDALDADSKNMYKKKTEAAKKEYLKALAAYRASLVSKGGVDGEGMYGGGYGGAAGYGGWGSPPQGPSPLAKKSPLLSSLMTENGQPIPSSQGMMVSGMQNPHVTTAAPQYMPPGAPPITSNGMQPMMSPQQQPMMQHMMVPPHQTMMTQPSPPHQQMHPLMQPPMQSMGQQQMVNQQQNQPPTQPPPQQQGPAQPQQSTNGEQTHNQGTPPPRPDSSGGQQPGQQVTNQQQAQVQPGGNCIRVGCQNPAIRSPDWEDEYCSSECVVSHCRDVFSHWVASNQAPPQNYPAASVK